MTCTQSLSLPLALNLDLCFKSQNLGVSRDLRPFLPTSLELVNLPVPRPDEPRQRSPVQGPHFARARCRHLPEQPSPLPSASHRQRPGQDGFSSRDVLRQPSTAQGQPPGAQWPSSPSSHLLLLHPCVPLHGQGRSAPGAAGQCSCALSGPFLGSCQRHPPPRGGPSPGHGPCKVHGDPCKVHSCAYGLSSPTACPAQGLQAGSLPSLRAEHPGTVTFPWWPPNRTPSLADVCSGHRRRAGAPSQLFPSLLPSLAAWADRRGRSSP